MVKHIFDCFFSFSEPPEIRTVEGFSAAFAFVRCEHRLCSQTKRATICATPRCSVLKAGVSHKTYYTPEGEKMSSIGACKNALTNPARYGTINTKTAATLDFSGVAAFLVTNLLLVQCSIAVLLYFCECRPFHPSPSICDP